MRNRRICYHCWCAKQREKRIEKAKKWAEIRAKRKIRHEQSESYRKTLFKKAWKVFSQYIRAGNESLSVDCFTCGKAIMPNEAHAGHFIHNKLDFDERNIHPQCAHCNTFLHGNLGIYAERLIEEGVDLKALRRDAEAKGNGYSISELHTIIQKYAKIYS